MKLRPLSITFSLQDKDFRVVYKAVGNRSGGSGTVNRNWGQTPIKLQIKARSDTVVFGDAALFAAITHDHRNNYWFVFYSERMDMTWIMTSEEFIQEATQNKTGKNKGKRSIWFNGRNTKKQIEHCKPQFEKYVVTNFDRLK